MLKSKLAKIGVILSTMAFGLLLVAPAHAAWVDIPSYSQIEASSTPYATGVFNSFLFVAFFILGLIVGVLLLKYVIGAVGRGAKSILRRRHR